MPLHLGWREIALRLGLAFFAALLIGLNRGKRHEAGLRTTLLVCLAAAVSMVQVNLLLDTDGKTAASFSVLDLMRLPLGILTGMGFIGAGAILKRGNMVVGVTTAASLWFTTVMGLCLGGGQIGLGLVSLAFALFVLAILKRIEMKQKREHRALLFLAVAADGINQRQLENIIREGNAEAVACSVSYRPSEQIRKYEFVVGWRAYQDRPDVPGFIEQLSGLPALSELKWIPEAVSSSEAENIAPE